MNKKQLIQKIAHLESWNDQLSSELSYLDKMARKLGFIDGIRTLKSAAYELLREQDENKREENDGDR